ncbi:phage integrase family protein [Palleronia aestuarii]|uniref:Phage integrase family protein n=1 Tax=Palleronia aestuarii TaxID=568105 RepID=A0A2W7NNW6_9RHOB|nr:site-specific integrase [Palleronia aestuarii]PZX19837.1 phage integrase family protein [Palleronia aestuarii]
MRKLTAIAVKNAPAGKLFDGGGLALVKKGATGKWVFRYSHIGRRREMGLGPWPIVTLAAARKRRDEWAAVLADGRDPLSERDARRAAEKAAAARFDPKLSDAVTRTLGRIGHKLRDGGGRGRWTSPLDTHVLPRLGRRPISIIAASDLVDVLRPIWTNKPSVATKAINRLRIIFREMRAEGALCDPATADTAKDMLGPLIYVAKPTPATPWQEIPALFRALSEPNVSDDCLRWMILTVVRLNGCSGARLSEIDGTVWTVPQDRMKGGVDHVTDFRVPLSRPCLDMVQEAGRFPSDLMFASSTGRAISSAALEKRLRTLGEDGRPHGFRTSFRTWVQDTNACDYEVSETIMAHKVDQKVQRSYARSDLLERRTPVMQAWADFVTGAAAMRADIVDRSR